jgi:hypothetical protein
MVIDFLLMLRVLRKRKGSNRNRINFWHPLAYPILLIGAVLNFLCIGFVGAMEFIKDSI